MRNSRVAVARLAERAMLYSRVPRSSAWPSTCTVTLRYCLSLAAERFLRFRGERRLVDQEVDAVADIDGEVLLRAWRRNAPTLEIRLIFLGTGRQRKEAAAKDRDLETRDATHHLHLLVRRTPENPRPASDPPNVSSSWRLR